jgi:omega-6 fatty acid desaturase (delta-12 desaturase)
MTHPTSEPDALTGESTLTPNKDTSWRALVAPYMRPHAGRALRQLLTTAVPFLALMAGMLIALHHGMYLTLALFPVGGVLLVRLFMFQHDCGHGSFFASRRANDILGTVLGVLTLTPYASWRGEHAVHHASMGNLDRRGIGDVTTLTLPEYMPRCGQCWACWRWCWTRYRCCSPAGRC